VIARGSTQPVIDITSPSLLRVAAISPNPQVDKVVVTKYKDVRYCLAVSSS